MLWWCQGLTCCIIYIWWSLQRRRHAHLKQIRPWSEGNHAQGRPKHCIVQCSTDSKWSKQLAMKDKKKYYPPPLSEGPLNPNIHWSLSASDLPNHQRQQERTILQCCQLHHQMTHKLATQACVLQTFLCAPVVVWQPGNFCGFLDSVPCTNAAS